MTRAVAHSERLFIVLCMATKTVSVDLEAYERLCRARCSEKESFSQVIKRAIWLPMRGTAASLLELTRSHDEKGGGLSEEELDRLDANQENEPPPPDRWEEEAPDR